jgi:CDP-glucose 4,6-dehydratase
MDLNFWRGRRVFITGHTGFKGSWLCLWLQRLGADVTGYALPPPTKPSLYEVARVGAGMNSVEGDVRDHKALRSAIEKVQPEIVIHMAAQSVVRQSYDDPIDTYSTNVMGTVSVLDAVRALRQRTAVVNVTTDKVYHNHEWVWGYRETDTLGGHDPYSNSKACSELATQSYKDSFFSKDANEATRKLIATARAGNVIGGGDWTRDQLIPDAVAAFNQKRPVVLRSPKAVRPWQHVLDCLGGYMTLAERLYREGDPFAESWNFGPRVEDVLTVQEIVERLIARWPDKATWSLDQGAHPHEAGYLRLDTSKTMMRLGWMPKLELPEALDWITEWYGRFFQGVDARALCIEQIQRFESKCKAK